MFGTGIITYLMKIAIAFRPKLVKFMVIMSVCFDF